jgi:hypothetical protein
MNEARRITMNMAKELPKSAFAFVILPLLRITVIDRPNSSSRCQVRCSVSLTGHKKNPKQSTRLGFAELLPQLMPPDSANVQ